MVSFNHTPEQIRAYEKWRDERIARQKRVTPTPEPTEHQLTNGSRSLGATTGKPNFRERARLCWFAMHNPNEEPKPRNESTPPSDAVLVPRELLTDLIECAERCSTKDGEVGHYRDDYVLALHGRALLKDSGS